MKIFLSIAAVLAWFFGAALILMPGDMYAPMGITMTPLIGTIAQAHGATLFGLGVVNWLARSADRKGLIAVLAGNLVVQLLSLAVILRTMTLGAGSTTKPGIVIHVLLGSLYLFFLMKARKMQAA